MKSFLIRCVYSIVCSVIFLMTLHAQSFVWPIDVHPIGQYYAKYGDVSPNKYHAGMDMGDGNYNYATSVKAVRAGVVHKIFGIYGLPSSSNVRRWNNSSGEYSWDGQPIIDRTGQSYGTDNHGLGLCVILYHDDLKIYTLYAHLDAIVTGLLPGHNVSAGGIIGKMGNSSKQYLRRSPTAAGTPPTPQGNPPTGYSWSSLIIADGSGMAPHLHFETKDRGVLSAGRSDSPTSSSEQHWGYTPGPAPSTIEKPGHPNFFGYHDPNIFFNETVTKNSTLVPVEVLNTINVRDYPSTSSSLSLVITEIRARSDGRYPAFVATRRIGTEWYQILLPNSESEGWSSSGWIMGNLNGTQYSQENTSLPQVKLQSESARIYSSANVSSSTIAFAYGLPLNEEQRFVPFETPEGWFRIYTPYKVTQGDGWLQSSVAVLLNGSGPVVSSFQVTPTSATLGDQITIGFSVSDDIGLQRVELWRTVDSSGAPKQSTWTLMQTTVLTGQQSYSGNITDTPGSTGEYWYGVHVVDSDGIVSVEPQPPGPTKVTITAAQITLIVTPNNAVNFGDVVVGQSKSLEISVKNSDQSTATVSISSASAEAPFQLSGGMAVDLAPNASHVFTVTFTPTVIQSYNKEFQFSHTAGNHTSPWIISLQGNGIATPPPVVSGWSNKPLVSSSYEETNPLGIRDASGNMIIAYSRINSNYDVYVQKINPNGTPLWNTEGTLLCNASNIQNSLRIVTDGGDGAIVVWKDVRDGNNDIYARHVDANGVPKWNANGNPVCTAVDAQENPQVVSDGASGAVIVWQDGRSGNYDIYAQRINVEGTSLWNTNGNSIASNSYNQTGPVCAEDGIGGAIIVWLDRLGGNYGLYAQRVNLYGQVQWASQGTQLTTSTTSTIGAYAIEKDGSGGALVTWSESRGGHYNIYIQRLSSSGQLLWSSSGVVLCDASGNQSAPKILSDNAGGAIVSWTDYRSGSAKIYAQKINASGSIQWTQNGIEVSANAVGSISNLYSDGLGGMVIAYDINYRIYAQKINTSGTKQWGASGLKVSDDYFSMSPSIISDLAGGAFVVWQDNRNSDTKFWDIYSSGVTSQGLLPVELTSFTATHSSGSVTLSWKTATETNNYGFIIQRRDELGPYADIGFVAGHGTSNTPLDYVFTDRKPFSGRMIYRLKQIDNDGRIEYTFEVETSAHEIPANFILSSNYPNPFNSSTVIRYALPADAYVRLAIYNPLGQKVAELVNGHQTAGWHDIEWHSDLGSGLYFYRIEAVGFSYPNNRFIDVKRMALVR